ncbi:MAG: RsmB/NOP family class I SAM-dependent RNA methyltransferase [Holosporaceae bacterium]|nr:RsmB/NOP family class I SAM-dependent RNA methyltransferase [Holosporaceae bacterium]
MRLNVNLSVVIDLLDSFLSSPLPFDAVMAKFFRNNRGAGSRERREIAEFSFALFRSFEKVRFFTSDISANFGRFYVLAFLKAEKGLSEEEISEIFCGGCRSPEKLTDFERKFLKSINGETEFPEYVQLNCPLRITPLLKESFPAEDFREEMLSLNQKAPIDLRVNTLKSSRDEVKRMLLESGVPAEDCRYALNGLRLPNGRVGRDHRVLIEGLAEIQDEGSQLAAEACDVSPGDVTIDFCAGAGGKTLALAAAMCNKGRIFALDKNAARLENAKIRLARAGANNVFCHPLTGKWIKRHRGCADTVLVDAPCSGIGTWRRNPDKRVKFTPEDLNELLSLQSEILETAAETVKDGGKLVYATCSVLKAENEDRAKKFLRDHPEFMPQKIRLRDLSGDFLKLTPRRHGTDGFFVAIFKRSG